VSVELPGFEYDEIVIEATTMKVKSTDKLSAHPAVELTRENLNYVRHAILAEGKSCEVASRRKPAVEGVKSICRWITKHNRQGFLALRDGKSKFFKSKEEGGVAELREQATEWAAGGEVADNQSVADAESNDENSVLITTTGEDPGDGVDACMSHPSQEPV